jgi:3-hydroxyacyl-CoA dehydrogenase/3-hydroxy-2-methylbutyryl-CoA dehydrogenase
MKIENRTFVVSGGSSGLGRACVEDLLAHGAHVAILDLQPPPDDLLGPRVHYAECDVTSTAAVAAAVSSVMSWLSDGQRRPPLGGLITAAGIALPATLVHPRTLEPLNFDALERMFKINVLGTLDLARQLAPHLARVPADDSDDDKERGVIVMVSSGAAYDGQRGQVGYAASKGAVASATLPMARDLGSLGVRVVTVAPGIFESPMTEMMSDKVRDSLRREMVFPVREGKGEEFAALVRHAFENKMLNGVVLRLDGGLRFPSRL